MSDTIYKDALFLIHVDTPKGVLDWLRRAFTCKVCGAIPMQDCIRQLGEVQASLPDSGVAACHFQRGQ
jgi:hypothetical protein